MKENVQETVKNEMRAKFDELIQFYALDYKDEIRILSMLTDDVSKQLVGGITIISK